MKIVFVGPTVPDAERHCPDLVIMPPARQGDVARAVQEGATGIGLIDGYFEHAPAVWHKEILFALSEGVRVAGAASMGALRAAECAPFGMEVIGPIAQSYADGTRLDDADVAQTHAPPQLGYLPLSEPLVTVEACLQALREAQEISGDAFTRLLGSARALFFKDRTWPRILEASGLSAPEEVHRLMATIRRLDCNPKRDDGRLLLDVVSGWPASRRQPGAYGTWKIEKVQGLSALINPKEES